MHRFAVAFALASIALPSLAADPKPVCAISLDKAISDAEELHGYLVDLIAVPAADFDQLLVTVANGGIWIAPVKNGCIVRAPFPLAPVREETPA